MPVGAIVGAVAGIGGALISSHANSKAINKASDAQAAASAQAAAVQRQIYQQNLDLNRPVYNTNIAAMNSMNALLGLPQQQAATIGAAQQQPTNSSPFHTSGFADANGLSPMLRQFAINRLHLNQANPGAQGVPAATPATPAVNPQAAAEAAYNQFKGYTGYTSRLAEANNALNGSYAARGTLQSGAAMQAMAKMNQDYASNEFGNYFGYLGNQAQMTSGAANTLSGVGTNYANAAGNIAINQGNNIANAAIARANNTSQLVNGIAGSIGGLSSYIK